MEWSEREFVTSELGEFEIINEEKFFEKLNKIFCPFFASSEHHEMLKIQ